jgi:hypothetical protein
MIGRWWKWLLLVVFAGSLLIWVCDQIFLVSWVGSTDLEVEFAVTDAGSGVSISGSRVEVQSEGGFYEERDKQEFVLVTDTSGSARKECRSSMCFGRASLLGFTDTYCVHLPFWRFRIVAAGYEPSDWTELDVLEYRRQVKRSGPGRAKLEVSVSLQKSRV